MSVAGRLTGLRLSLRIPVKIWSGPLNMTGILPIRLGLGIIMAAALIFNTPVRL